MRCLRCLKRCRSTCTQMFLTRVEYTVKKFAQKCWAKYFNFLLLCRKLLRYVVMGAIELACQSSVEISPHLSWVYQKSLQKGLRCSQNCHHCLLFSTLGIFRSLSLYSHRCSLKATSFKHKWQQGPHVDTELLTFGLYPSSSCHLPWRLVLITWSRRRSTTWSTWKDYMRLQSVVSTVFSRLESIQLYRNGSKSARVKR